MTQGSNTGGDEITRPTSSSEFDTVELRGSVPVVPAGMDAGDVLSSSTGTGTGATYGTTGTGTYGTAGMGTSGGTSGSMERAVDRVQDTAGQAVGQVQETAGQVVDQAKQTATAQAQSQKDRAAQSIGTVAQALRQTGDQLRGQEQGAAVAQYVDRAADQVERFSGFLQNRDVGQIVNDVERYARRNPTLFVGGAFALGLLAARFLKSSSQPDQGQMGGQYAASRQYDYYPAQPDLYRSSSLDRTTTYGTGTTGYGTTGYSGTTGYDRTTDYGGATAGTEPTTTFGSTRTGSGSQFSATEGTTSYGRGSETGRSSGTEGS